MYYSGGGTYVAPVPVQTTAQHEVIQHAPHEVSNAPANPAQQINLGTPLDWNDPNTANSEAAKQLRKQMKNSTGWENNDFNQKELTTTEVANYKPVGGTERDYVESQSNTGQNRYATSVANSSANKSVGGFLGNNGFSGNSGPGHSLL